jgi:hypothetical protein
MGLAWGRMACRMGLAWGRMGPHGVSTGPRGAAWGVAIWAWAWGRIWDLGLAWAMGHGPWAMGHGPHGAGAAHGARGQTYYRDYRLQLQGPRPQGPGHGHARTAAPGPAAPGVLRACCARRARRPGSERPSSGSRQHCAGPRSRVWWPLVGCWAKHAPGSPGAPGRRGPRVRNRRERRWCPPPVPARPLPQEPHLLASSRPVSVSRSSPSCSP